jgi:hypothetical protein
MRQRHVVIRTRGTKNSSAATTMMPPNKKRNEKEMNKTLYHGKQRGEAHYKPQ